MKTVKEWMELAEKYGQEKNYVESLRCCREALALDSNYAPAYYAIGLANIYGTKDYAAAIRWFEETLMVSPDYAPACAMIGYAHHEQGNHAEALRYCRKALSISKNYIKDLVAANPHLARQIQTDDSPAQTHSIIYDIMGNAYEAQGNIAESIRCYEEVIRIEKKRRHPNPLVAYLNLANIYSEQEQYAQAIHYYEKAIAFAPTFAMSYTHMGITKNAQGDRAGALVAWQKAAALGDDHAKNLLNTYGKKE